MCVLKILFNMFFLVMVYEHTGPRNALTHYTQLCAHEPCIQVHTQEFTYYIVIMLHEKRLFRNVCPNFTYICIAKALCIVS